MERALTFSTWVEIDLDALTHNIGEVRSRIGDGLRTLLVVKADAYGHGAVEVARVAVAGGVDMLGVATLQEGIELRQAGIDAPVLILSPPMEDETDGIVEYDLSSTVPSLAIARALSRAARARGGSAAVHVEVDTGMGRSGVILDDALPFVAAVSKLPDLTLEGVFTHFPSSDDDREFTERQVDRFRTFLDRLARKGVVRPGIMVYGLRPSRPASNGLALEPVMSFKSRIAQLRELPANHPVSYGRTYTTQRAMRVAVIPVGYGHGYSWRLSNAAEVLIRGHRAPVVGRVTMDVTMADIDAIPDAAVGDEVVLFGSQGTETITVDEVAERVGTINYEIICGIGKRVARVYVRRGETIGLRTLTERRVVGRRRWRSDEDAGDVS